MIALTLLFGISVSLAAQKTPDYLRVDFPRVKLKVGASMDASLHLKVAAGFHIQANPAARPNLIPTTVVVEKPDGLEVGQVLYPEGKPYRLKGSDSEITTYEGDVEIKLPLSATVKSKPGKRKVSGYVRFQPCNEENCFFPSKATFSGLVDVR